MTITIYPPVHDVVTDHPTPTGVNSPVTITPPTHDSGVAHRASASPGSAGAGAILDLTPPMLPALGRWNIFVTDRNGGVTGSLLSSNPGVDRWTVESIKWTLNSLGSVTISGPVHDPELVALYDFAGNVRDGVELRVERDDLGVLQVCVPSPRISLSAGTRRIQMQCPGLAYHLTRKYVGRNNPAPELITNGGFDSDVSSWTSNALATMLWSASPVDSDPGSLVATSALRGDYYAYQTVTIPAKADSTFIWIKASCYLDAAVDRTKMPTSGRGLWTVHRVGGTVVWQQGVSPNWRLVGDWQELSTKIFIPANQTSTMEVRLYCPLGTIRWDTVSAHREERLICDGTPGAVIGCLITHAQDPSLNKVHMLIDHSTVRGEGTIETKRHYKYAEAAKISSAMGEMADIAGGCDWLLETPDSSTRRVFTMERTGYDLGSSEVTLEWGRNLAAVEDVWTPDRRADQVRVQGRGSGNEITEAFWDDGVNLGWEFIRRASIEGSPNPQEQVDGIGLLYRRPLTLQLTVNRTIDFDPAHECAPANGTLLPGRIVTVKVVEGVVNINERFKIIDTELKPEQDVAILQVIPIAQLEDV